jgi:hypothetical protein
MTTKRRKKKTQLRMREKNSRRIEMKKLLLVLTFANLSSCAIFLNCCNGFCKPPAILSETALTLLENSSSLLAVYDKIV